jgi:lipopolysaccharide/colanic/teichoic acid biosynthesis glycosyltransferase
MSRDAAKRALDIAGSAAALVLSSPVILVATALIWLDDHGNPIYAGERIGKDGAPFRCFKLRTMTIGADRTGVDTTVRGDPRITRLGHVLRKYKLDELPQFWNVLKGDMSLVGPRPNVGREVANYSAEERRSLDIRPGVTDFSSIVFSDLAEILAGSADPNLDYNRLVRPWKSRLMLHYADHRATGIDLALLALTAIGIANKPLARRGVSALLLATGASEELVSVSRRTAPLSPAPPPGLDYIVTRR